MKIRSILALSVVAVIVVACTSNTTTRETTDSVTIQDSLARQAEAKQLRPMGPPPEWGKTIHPEMQVVMEKLASYGDKPIETLNATLARKNHTPTDAVMDVMAANAIAAPAPECDTAGINIDVPDGKVHLRIYTPKSGNGPFPVIVYYHGGGFVIASLDAYNASAQALCEQTGAVVVSVAYRLAPEKKFPTAHNDSFAAYEWVTKNAASIKGDPKKIAVAGESAGGNLAANVAIMARDKKITTPVFQLLVYPVTQTDMNTRSYKDYAMARPLNKAMMDWFVGNYLISKTQAMDPRINLVAANLKGLPPALIINAEIDPLADDGRMFADKLKAAGVQVDHKMYDGVTHEFFGMAAVVPEAKQAQADAAEAMKKAFGR